MQVAKWGVNRNFDDTLKEIDAALNAFDGTSNVSPRIKEACLDDVQSGGIIMGKEVGAEDISAGVQEDHGANIDNSTSLGGSLRGWKRLARDKIGGGCILVVLVVEKDILTIVWKGWQIWCPLRDVVLALKTMKQWRLRLSPAEPNELLSLELPWAWDPT